VFALNANRSRRLKSLFATITTEKRQMDEKGSWRHIGLGGGKVGGDRELRLSSKKQPPEKKEKGENEEVHRPKKPQKHRWGNR